MSTTTYRKACQCGEDPRLRALGERQSWPSASGPRVVASTRIEPQTDAIIVTASLVAMACDRCDTPWELDAGGEQPPLQPVQAFNRH